MINLAFGDGCNPIHSWQNCGMVSGMSDLRMAMPRSSTAAALWRSNMAGFPCWHAQEAQQKLSGLKKVWDRSVTVTLIVLVRTIYKSWINLRRRNTCCTILNDVVWCYTGMMSCDILWFCFMLYDVARCSTVFDDVVSCRMLYDVVWCCLMLCDSMYDHTGDKYDYTFVWFYKRVLHVCMIEFWCRSLCCILGLRIHCPGVLQIPWLHLAF